MVIVMDHSLGTIVLVLVVYALAAARVTKLINSDTILDPVRLAIGARARDSLRRSESERRRWVALFEFLICPWCVGMWVVLGTVWVPLYFASNPVAQYLAVALAVSHLIGAFAPFVSHDVIDFETDDDEDADPENSQ